MERRSINLTIQTNLMIQDSGEGYIFECREYDFFYKTKDRTGWAHEEFDNAFREHLKKILLNHRLDK